MATTHTITGLPPDLLAELQSSAEKAGTGVLDPDKAERACEEMDRISEEIRKKHGILDIGVPAIRELRNAE